MTRREGALTAGAVLLTTAGTATVVHDMWWETGTFWLVAALLIEGVIRERRVRLNRQRWARITGQRAELAARGPAPLPVRCCQIWKSSEGAVHGADCTRPPAARTTLRDAEQRLLNRIADDSRDGA